VLARCYTNCGRASFTCSEDDCMGTLEFYGAASLGIGAIVRLLKSDVPIVPIDVAPRYRPFVALALGVLASCFDMMARGTEWREALVSGLLAGAGAIAAHETLVEGWRGGRDVGVSESEEAAREFNDAVQTCPHCETAFMPPRGEP